MTPSPYSTDLDKNDANYTQLSPLTFIERAAAVYPNRTAIVYGNHRQSWAETQRDMTLSLTSTLDIEEILSRLLKGLSEVVSSDKSVVSIDREGLPRCQVQRGFEAKDLPNFREVQGEIQRFSKSSQAEPMTLSAMDPEPH